MDWVKIFGNAEEATGRLPINKPQLLIVRGTRICIVQTSDGLRAVADKCPHNGESLSKGSINFINEVVCPWHGQRFNIKTGRECEGRSRDLTVYPLKEESNGIFIGI